MPSTPDHAVKAAASPSLLRVLIVSGDNIAAVLAARLFERLGYPRPERLASLEEADACHSRFDLLLVDADLEQADRMTADWLRARGERPRIFVMSTDAIELGADGRLRKPLTLAALSAALASDAVADSRPQDDSAAVILADLRRPFGADGAQQLVGALVDDLPTQQQRAAAAIRDRDLVALKRVAHTLRGVGLQLGASVLVQRCDEAESAADAGDPEAAIESGLRLMQCHEALVERLRDEVGQR